MKTLEELEELLLEELKEYWSQNIPHLQVEYYNQFTGNTSIFLTSILEKHLLKRDDWNGLRWLDDCLLKNFQIVERLFMVEGIMIWGMEGTTEQWTDPFCFEIQFDEIQKSYVWYKYLLADLNYPQITYEEFNENRNYWSQSEREWKYSVYKKQNV